MQHADTKQSANKAIAYVSFLKNYYDEHIKASHCTRCRSFGSFYLGY